MNQLTLWNYAIHSGYAGIYTAWLPDDFTRFLRCRLGHYQSAEETSQNPLCFELKQCQQRLAEYQIDTKDLKTRGHAIVVTTCSTVQYMQEFGEIRTPIDSNWRCHFASGIEKSFTPGSIKEAFEGSTKGFDFEAHASERAQADLWINYPGSEEVYR